MPILAYPDELSWREQGHCSDSVNVLTEYTTGQDSTHLVLELCVLQAQKLGLLPELLVLLLCISSLLLQQALLNLQVSDSHYSYSFREIKGLFAVVLYQVHVLAARLEPSAVHSLKSTHLSFLAVQPSYSRSPVNIQILLAS